MCTTVCVCAYCVYHPWFSYFLRMHPRVWVQSETNLFFDQKRQAKTDEIYRVLDCLGIILIYLNNSQYILILFSSSHHARPKKRNSRCWKTWSSKCNWRQWILTNPDTIETIAMAVRQVRHGYGWPIWHIHSQCGTVFHSGTAVHDVCTSWCCLADFVFRYRKCVLLVILSGVSWILFTLPRSLQELARAEIARRDEQAQGGLPKDNVQIWI